MSTDANTEAKPQKEHDRRLTDLVAVTVVILTVFLAVCKVKDDNIVQAMQKALLQSVDAWTEYQSSRIKLHVDENGLSTLRLIETAGAIDKDAGGQAGGRIRVRYQEVPGALARDASQGRAAGEGIRAAQLPRRSVRYCRRVRLDRDRAGGGGGAGRRLLDALSGLGVGRDRHTVRRGRLRQRSPAAGMAGDAVGDVRARPLAAA
jgi:uncharacterized protein DUF4337